MLPRWFLKRPCFRQIVGYTATPQLFNLYLYFSRDLLQDKQEELDATQSQAHWIVLQQEAMITDTTKELSEIWDLVNDLLVEFNKEAFAIQVNPNYCIRVNLGINCYCSLIHRIFWTDCLVLYFYL